MEDNDDPKSDRVGYGRPPVHTRFKPGVSGNPKGRPKGALNFSTAFEKTLNKPTTYTENGRTKQVSTREAIFLKLRHMALSGDPKALALTLGYDAQLSERWQTANAATNQTDDEQFIEDFLRTRMERQAARGKRSTPDREEPDE